MTEPAARGLGKGIKSVHDLKYVQDGPPAGGFPAIRYARRLGTPGPTGVAIFGVGAAICCYGFYRVGQANQKRNAYLREKAAARKALLPILQAEEVSKCTRSLHALNTHHPFPPDSKDTLRRCARGLTQPETCTRARSARACTGHSLR